MKYFFVRFHSKIGAVSGTFAYFALFCGMKKANFIAAKRRRQRRKYYGFLADCQPPGRDYFKVSDCSVQYSREL
jgi:hypothetical protein